MTVNLKLVNRMVGIGQTVIIRILQYVRMFLVAPVNLFYLAVLYLVNAILRQHYPAISVALRWHFYSEDVTFAYNIIAMSTLDLIITLSIDNFVALNTDTQSLQFVQHVLKANIIHRRQQHGNSEYATVQGKHATLGV